MVIGGAYQVYTARYALLPGLKDPENLMVLYSGCSVGSHGNWDRMVIYRPVAFLHPFPAVKSLQLDQFTVYSPPALFVYVTCPPPPSDPEKEGVLVCFWCGCCKGADGLRRGEGIADIAGAVNSGSSVVKRH